MTIYRCFPHTYNGLRPRTHKVNGLLLITALFAALSHQAAAFTLDVQVADGIGGRVVSVPGNTDCVPYCTIEASSRSVVSLFALPDKAYRFDGWTEACVHTIGPLCTLIPSENIRLSARFVKVEAPQPPTKALLLLHNEGAKHTVWNEFVKQRFNNRCPVIYGGVVLGDDSFDPRNKVYCYRIAFGYYDMLKHSKAGDGRQMKKRFSSKYLGYEVRAAVLGVLNRHPNLSLTLVGQARAALAARSFLQSDTAEGSDVVGLLALQQFSDDGNDAASEPFYGEAFQTERVAVLELEAGPEQDGKISAALAQLTKSWWMSR